MDLEQRIPLSEETGISVDLTVVYQDLSGISVTVDDCLDQDQACILSVAKMFGKGCQDIRIQQNQIFIRLGQFISHLLFNSILSILTKTSLCILTDFKNATLG